MYIKTFIVEQALQQSLSTRYRQLQDQVNKTIDTNLLRPYIIKLSTIDDTTLQKVIRLLKTQLVPTKTSTLNTIREEYYTILEQVKQGRVKLERQLKDQLDAFARTQAYRIPNIQGVLATKDFLSTLSIKIAPKQAIRILTKLITNNKLRRP